MNIVARIFEANGESVCEVPGVRISSSPGGAGELFEKYVRKGSKKAQARARAQASANYHRWAQYASARHTPGDDLPSWPAFLAEVAGMPYYKVPTYGTVYGASPVRAVKRDDARARQARAAYPGAAAALEQDNPKGANKMVKFEIGAHCPSPWLWQR